MKPFSSSILAHSAMNQASIGIAVYDSSGKYQYVNRHFSLLLRSTINDLEGTPVWELRESMTENRFNEFWNGFDPGEKLQLKDEMNLVAGSTVPVKILTSRIMIGNTPYQLETIENTRYKQKQDERLQSFKKAVQQAGHVIIITDSNGVIEYVNPTFEAVTGYTESEVLGKSPRILKSGQHDEAFYRELWETITRGETWKGELINQ
ncbi:MAG: PAS domain S-box protein [bacterium]